MNHSCHRFARCIGSTMENKNFLTFPSEDILGYDVCTSDIDTIISGVVSHICSDSGCKFFVCLNPHSAEIAENDELFRKSILNSEFITADGVGIIIASILVRGNIRNRVTGNDIFEGTNKALDAIGGKSVFLLGSSPENLMKMKSLFSEDYPNIQISGSLSPELSDSPNRVHDAQIVEMINKTKSDVVWVGLGAPKQEKWVFRNYEQLNVKFIGPIGAVFDFYTNNIERAGPIWQKLGLEWLPRLLQEPKRLWRRSLVSGPRFLIRVLLRKSSNISS